MSTNFPLTLFLTTWHKLSIIIHFKDPEVI